MYHMAMPDTTPDQVAVAILETIPASMRAIREQMRAGRTAGSSVAQYRLLRFVRRNPDTGLSAVADHLGTSLPSASQMVDRLVRAALMTRRQAPQERRRVELHLTAAGDTALSQTDEQTRAWLCERLAGLDAGQLEEIEAALRKVRSVLEAGAKK
jgi:DNA-binding MarR family transcriptional regulator